jgi:NADH-quinone oxidoreductase subunit F
MVDVAYQFSRFLFIESCGQCPPCKTGSREITTHLEHLTTGTGTDDDVNGIGHWLRQVTDGSRCFLAAEEQAVVSSILRAFPDDFAAHIESGTCGRRRGSTFPKLVDLANGRAAYDESFWRKRPDWTYAD